MAQTSIKLFNAWTARYKELVALQDALAAAQRDSQPEAADLLARVDTLQAVTDRMLAEAQACFRSELKARGITD